jgi:hypothetical protein
MESKEHREHRVNITSVRTDAETGEKAASRRFVHYVPDVVDFIRRCDTKEQAEEIVNYLEKRGEISRDYAQKIRKQLCEKGVRSFGSKKEEGYYFKHGTL